MVRFLTTTAPLLVSFLYVIYFFHHSMKYLVSWSISLSLLRKPNSRSVHFCVLHLSCRYADNLGQKQIYIPQSTPSGHLLPLYALLAEGCTVCQRSASLLGTSVHIYEPVGIFCIQTVVTLLNVQSMHEEVIAFVLIRKDEGGVYTIV